MQLTTSFQDLLVHFQVVFTQPSFHTFASLLTGWCLSPRPRFVTECIQSSDSVRSKHHSSFHRFFSHSVWSLDSLCQVLAVLLVSSLVPSGLIHLAVDDTLCHKSGLTLFGAGMHYDPCRSSKSRAVVSWGHDRVVLFLVIRGLPWCPSKVWALPIAFRLYRNRQGNAKSRRRGCPAPPPAGHKTRPELAVELLALVASWFPGRTLVACGDSLYGGRSVLKSLPGNVHLVSRVDAKAAMYEPAPEVSERGPGRPRKKGARLSGMKDWAADESQPWQDLDFNQFGLRGWFRVKARQCLYYTAGGTRLLTVVLVQDRVGKRPDQMWFSTMEEWDARTILDCYACRWSAEVTFRDCKQLLGFEDAANRVKRAVERTAPTGMVLYSLAVLWCERGGHAGVRFPERPWYREKREASFADVLSALRRKSWEESLAGVRPESGGGENPLAWLVDFASRAA